MPKILVSQLKSVDVFTARPDERIHSGSVASTGWVSVVVHHLEHVGDRVVPRRNFLSMSIFKYIWK